MTLAILLVIASLALFVLEVFFVSFGALTAAAVGLGVFGIIAAFDVSSMFGWIMAGLLFVGIPACIRFAFVLLPKLPFARGFTLEAPAISDQERRAAAGGDTALIGREGIAESPLRPAGVASFEGDVLHVVSTGGMIAPGVRVKVVKVTGNRIVVEEV